MPQKSSKKKEEKDSATPEASQESEEDVELEDIPLVGGLFKGIEKLVNLAEKVEKAGGEVKKQRKIKGLNEKEGVRGVYGFSVRTGIGKQPQVQTFGNIRPVKKKTGQKKVKVVETREPIVDIFDEKDHVLIIVELPGVTEESVKLSLKGNTLILEATNEKRKYYKEISLPVKVDFEIKKISFKNGVLEVKMKK